MRQTHWYHSHVCVFIKSKVIDKKKWKYGVICPFETSSEVTSVVFVNNFWLNRDKDMGFVSKCLSRQGASTDMQHDLSEPTGDLDLRWPQVKLWNWPFEVIKYMLRTDSTRESHWCQNYCSMLMTSTFIHENYFSKKRYFDIRWPLEPWMLTSAQERWENVGSPPSELSNAFCDFVLAVEVSEPLESFQKTYVILENLISFDLWCRSKAYFSIDFARYCLFTCQRYVISWASFDLREKKPSTLHPRYSPCEV